VICCSDHGDAVASHGGLWDKASTFIEEVARIPLAVRWPAGFAGGRRVARLVSNLDVTATMLDAAGVLIPEHMPSRSLLPLCRDPGGAAWPDQIVCEHNGHGENILLRMIVCGQHKYVAALWDMDELYDLAADPHEMTNLANEPAYASVGADLRRRLIEHLEQSKDPVAARPLYALRIA